MLLLKVSPILYLTFNVTICSESGVPTSNPKSIFFQAAQTFPPFVATSVYALTKSF